MSRNGAVKTYALEGVAADAAGRGSVCVFIWGLPPGGPDPGKYVIVGLKTVPGLLNGFPNWSTLGWHGVPKGTTET